MTSPLLDLDPAEDPAELLIPVDNYALKPLPEAFENFDEIVPPLLGSSTTDMFDVTVFYSRRKGISEAQHETLLAHNQRAYEAAKKADGLILYYQGHLLVDPTRAEMSPHLKLNFVPDCMSFCIWESLELARVGSSVSEHKAAASRTGEWYEGFAIKKYHLKVERLDEDGKRHRKIILEEYERPSVHAVAHT